MHENVLKIMLTCVNSQVSPSLIQLIRGYPGYDVRVIGVDTVSLNDNLGKCFCDQCYQVPLGSDKDYITAIKNIIRENDIRLIFPGSDEECLELSKYRDELKNLDCEVCCSPYEVILLASDKYELMKKLKDNGIPVAEVYSAKTIEDVRGVALMLGYPENDFVIKPKFGRGSKGFRIVTSKKDKYAAFYAGDHCKLTLEELIDVFSCRQEEIHKFLMMEYYPGDKYSADALVSKGEIISMVMRNNGSLPKIKPPTQDAKIVFDEDVREYAESIVKLINIDYFVQVESGRTKEGKIGLIEINTRLDATLPITMGLGLNFFHEMITYAITGKMRNDIKDYRNYSKNLRFRRYWQHIFEELPT